MGTLTRGITAAADPSSLPWPPWMIVSTCRSATSIERRNRSVSASSTPSAITNAPVWRANVAIAISTARALGSVGAATANGAAATNGSTADAAPAADSPAELRVAPTLGLEAAISGLELDTSTDAEIEPELVRRSDET